MRRPGSRHLAAALAVAIGTGLGVGAAGPGLSQASACGRDGSCRGYGYRPHPAYSAPAVYSYVSPYTGVAAPYAYRRRVPAFAIGTYTTRLNIFRGPRWNYSAAYYTSPAHRRGSCRRARACSKRQAYLAGPFVRVVGWRRR